MGFVCLVHNWIVAHPDLTRLAAIAGAVVVSLAPWLLNGDLAIVSPTELGTDFITKQWPNAVYIVRAWQQWGEVPLWRNTAMGGIPIVGNPSMLLPYPPYWLIFLFPIGWAFTLYFTLHLVWAGWGVYGLARRMLRLSPGAALLSALIFALSAKVIAHIGGGHIDIVAAVSWLPWLWWSVDRLARRPGWLPMMVAAMATAAQALTHLPTLWLSVLITGCWWLSARLGDRGSRSLQQWLQCGLAGLAAAVLAIGLSAVQIWPMLELLPYSTRSAMTMSEASQYALPVPLLIGFALPTALAFPEWVIYAGVVALALAPASWLARDSTRGWSFFVILVVLGTAFSLGHAMPLYPLLFRVLPGMNWLRVPTRMMFLVQLAWALLTGMGWDAMGQKQLRWRQAFSGWWTALTLLIAIGAVWSNRVPGALAVPLGSFAVAAASLAVLMGQSHLRAVRAFAPAALAALILLEAVVLAPQFMARGSVAALKTPTPAITFLRSQLGRFRVYSPRGLISLAQAVAHGIETADGNDPFQLDYYVRWANVAGGCDLDVYAVSVPTCASNEVDPEAYLHVQPDPALLGIGNVHYIVADHDLSQWPSPVWQSGSVRIHENPEALPTAFVSPTAVVEADDAAALALMQTRNPTRVALVARAPEEGLPSGGVYREAQVTQRTSNRIDVQADGPGWLVVSEVWAPGWRASINGTQAEVYRTDVAFCGLPLPDGSHMVTLTYEPTGWVWGRWISVSAAVATATMTAAVLSKQHCRTSYGRRSKTSIPSDP